MSEPPPPPSHILRTHKASVTSLAFSKDNLRLYSSDADGTVTVTSTLSLRPVTSWKAHEKSVLGAEEWEDCIITHGRDNKLHIWGREHAPAIISESAVGENASDPQLRKSLHVNALNYCRFSLLGIREASESAIPQALIAVPNEEESALVDIWSIPQHQRVHVAVGTHPDATSSAQESPENEAIHSKTGIIMAMRLYMQNENNTVKNTLCLLTAYESGALTLWRYSRPVEEQSKDGNGWQALWSKKAHVESVMAMELAPDLSFALSTSSEHLLVKYIIEYSEKLELEPIIHRIRSHGNGSMAIRSDSKICAIGGWDGKIRLYSTKSCKSLGTLDYHKSSCQAVAFAYQLVAEKEKAGVTDSDYKETAEIVNWLVGGGKDGRISIWKLMDFRKK